MPYLKKLPTGKLSLAASWFRSVRDRIEEIKPVAGDGIAIQNKTEGQTISVDLQQYILNICKDGAPDTLKVYGPTDQ
jgi:hypothetical protein